MLDQFPTSFVVTSADYKIAFTQVLRALSPEPRHLEFLATPRASPTPSYVSAWRRRRGCAPSPQQATDEDEQVLTLLHRLLFLIERSKENHYRLHVLAVSTAVWIERGGHLREIDLIVSLIVSAIAEFANQNKQTQNLTELYDITPWVLYAVDDFFKADQDKRNLLRPWRLLCLNHCSHEHHCELRVSWHIPLRQFLLVLGLRSTISVR